MTMLVFGTTCGAAVGMSSDHVRAPSVVYWNVAVVSSPLLVIRGARGGGGGGGGGTDE